MSKRTLMALATALSLAMGATALAQTPPPPPPEPPPPPAAPPAPTEAKPEFKAQVRVFADFTNRTVKDDATGFKTDASGTGFDLKRFYFGGTAKLDSHWSATFVSDVGATTTPRNELYVKYAYIQYQYSPALSVRLGSALPPWEGFEDPVAGQNMRYIEPPPTDRLGFAASGDYGLHFLGKSGIFGYAVSIVNGRRFVDFTRTKTVDFEGTFTVNPVKPLTFAVGGYTGKRGQELENNPAEHTATRWNLGALYKTDQLGVFAEYWQNRNWNNIQVTQEDKSVGYAGNIKFNFNPMWGLFARYDHIEPSKDVYSDVKNKLIIGAVEFRPIKGVAISLVYKNEKFDNAMLTGDPITGADYPGLSEFAYDNAGHPSALSFASANMTVNRFAPGNTAKYEEIGIFALYDF